MIFLFKKFIILVSFIGMVCYYSIGQPTATLKIGGVFQPPPGSVFLPITVEAIGGGDNFGTFQFFILYDPDVVTPVGVEFSNPNLPFYEWSNNMNYGPNEIILTWLSFVGGYTPSPGEELCQVEFLYDAGYTDIYWGTSEQSKNDKVKGMTAVWTSFGTQYSLYLYPGYIFGSYWTNTWTGNENSDWFEGGNWSTGYYPEIDQLVYIHSTINQPEINFPGALADQLIIYEDATLTIGANGSITGSNDFFNYGNIIIDCDKYGNSGSLIFWNSTTSGNGTFTFKKNINKFGILGAIDIWHNISSPIDSFNTHNILDYYVNSWDESLDEWETISNGDPCNPTNPPVNINPMQGWSIKLNQDIPITCPPGGTGAIIEFTGPITSLHQGSYSIPFTATNSGYNLLGNPYPSYVDPALINWPANLNQAIYFQSAWAESYWSWVGGIGPNIPPAQGFFVKATDDGTLTFTGDERVHDSISTNELPANEKLLCLKVSNLENQLFDLTYIRFKKESTTGFDQQWDAYKMFTESKRTPQLYTKSTMNDLSINTMPETASVPVYFTSGEPGNYTIKANQVENFDEVYLEDLLKGETTDLLDQEYSFNYDPGGNPGRFVVHFGSVGIKEINTDRINICSHEGRIIIQSSGLMDGEITIYNLLGQKIHSERMQSSYKEIYVEDINSVYIVKIVTQESAFAKTILLN